MIKFNILSTGSEKITAATESGYKFQIPAIAAITENKINFTIEDLHPELLDNNERTQLAHAVINEIIGAPVLPALKQSNPAEISEQKHVR